MVVFVLAACPGGLRGHLTRWLTEVHPGVFVGCVNPRLRDRLWELVVSEVHDGRALLVYADHAAEQGFSFRSHRHAWTPRDVEGLTVLVRPRESLQAELHRGWSAASRRRWKR
ncbi:CRISPR-associated endoribonuclease Cas2 [Pseudoclavibacter triregionum]|nr:CRISPR-associated endoribonuclease Cas2 [Pseudoclavibacter triregionum]